MEKTIITCPKCGTTLKHNGIPFCPKCEKPGQSSRQYKLTRPACKSCHQEYSFEILGRNSLFICFICGAFYIYHKESDESLILALRDKCINGNEKLYVAWEQICKLAEVEREESESQYDIAVKKLHTYCSLLKELGYADCLYMDGALTPLNDKEPCYVVLGKKTKNCLKRENQPNWFCRVCPSEKDYWEKEIFA